MTIPMLLGLGVLLFVIGRSATMLAEQNRKLILAEQKTAAALAELETVLASITSLLFVTDRDGRLTRVNQAFAEKFAEEWLGQSLADLCRKDGSRPFLHEDGQAFVKGQFPQDRALAGEAVADETILVREKDGREVYYLASASPIRDPASGEITGSVALLQDISTLKQLEKAKDEFLNVVSHELRTPLAVVRAYAQLSLAEERPQNALRSLMAEIDQVSRLLEQMLQITRLEAGRLSLKTVECDLAQATLAEIGRLSLAPGYDRVVVDAAGVAGPLICRLDSLAFSQIMGNLVSNALKYSKAPNPVVVKLSAEEGKAVVSVIDHGIGIPEDELSLIFNKFYRARKAAASDTPGLGLGLYLTSRLVELMPGELRVESKVRQGTAFHVAFPLRS
jgi:PAS domain S-box-containing protein